jgi:hypothetical protein
MNLGAQEQYFEKKEEYILKINKEKTNQVCNTNNNYTLELC